MGLGLIHKIPLLFGKKYKTMDKSIAKIQRRKNALIKFQKILNKS